MGMEPNQMHFITINFFKSFNFLHNNYHKECNRFHLLMSAHVVRQVEGNLGTKEMNILQLFSCVYFIIFSERIRSYIVFYKRFANMAVNALFSVWRRAAWSEART